MKTNIAVFFGCRSVEHEVSIISAVQAMRAIDTDKYDVTPVYVTKDGAMYNSDKMFETAFKAAESAGIENPYEEAATFSTGG